VDLGRHAGSVRPGRPSPPPRLPEGCTVTFLIRLGIAAALIAAAILAYLLIGAAS
jgi:hypothetical protein